MRSGSTAAARAAKPWGWAALRGAAPPQPARSSVAARTAEVKRILERASEERLQAVAVLDGLLLPRLRVVGARDGPEGLGLGGLVVELLRVDGQRVVVGAAVHEVHRARRDGLDAADRVG